MASGLFSGGYFNSASIQAKARIAHSARIVAALSLIQRLNRRFFLA
jgi:hypothetical protein